MSRRLGRHLFATSATAVIAAVLHLGGAPGLAYASQDDEIAQLKKLIIEQKKISARQEQRLAEQEKRLAKQSKLLDDQRREIENQRDAIDKQKQLTRQQGLILTMQDQDIYELRTKQDNAKWPDSGSAAAERRQTTILGQSSGNDILGVSYGAVVRPENRRNQPGLILTQGVTPQAPVPVPPGQDDPPPQAPVPPDGQPPAAGAPPDGARPQSEKAVEQLLVEAGGILLPAGTLQVEPSVEYAHFSSDRLQVNGLSIFDAVIIGFIRADDVDRDTVTAALTARMGIVRRVQGDIRIPYIYREDRETLAVGTAQAQDRSFNNHDLGDINAGLSFQPILGRGSIPDITIRIDGTFPTGENPFEIPTVTVGPGGETRLSRSPTGSGFYSVGGTMTAVWTSDPVVFFAGGGYTAILAREFERFGDVDPGDQIRFFAGMNVALSDKVSLNLSFSDSLSGRTVQNGVKTPNSTSNDARLILGTSVGISPGTSFLVSAGVGLTEDAPDFTFTVSLPLTFRGLY